MKHIYRKLICLAFLAACCAFSGKIEAQTHTYNIDAGIHAIRNSVIPGFSYEYDDYLQYAPAGVMLGLKVCGYRGATGWWPMLVGDAFSVAATTIVVNGLKYSVRRLRPDGSRHNSFPSGHTATAFMTATMLHKEYGWRSPWFSIGAYTCAAVTGVSRIMNNRHWMSDVVAGAAIGIGSVHLGYWLSSLIFKDRTNTPEFRQQEFSYNSKEKHYTAELFFGQRFILGAEGRKEMGVIPTSGSIAGISADIPIVPGLGITARGSVSSMSYSSGITSPMYSTLAGGFWNFSIVRRLELQVRAMAGCAWFERHSGIDLATGIGLSLITDDNFKIKAFADFESVSLSQQKPWLNSFIIGFGTAWFL